MTRSRRDFLSFLGMGTAVGVACQWPVESFARPSASQPTQSNKSDGGIYLDSNENAYGPSSKVAEAIRSASGLVNRYPFRNYEQVTDRIASFHKVKPEQVLVGCGSTEILRAAAMAFLGKDRQLIQGRPTFEAMQYYAKSSGSEVVSVPITSTFAHDLDPMLARIQPATGLVYICNPNNPTASLTPRQDLADFIAKVPMTTRILIDEAYHYYAGQSGMYASFLDHAVTDERLIVIRTFSNVYGLAGLRIGYAVASAKTIESMKGYITQDGLNSIAAEVIAVALNDTEGTAQAVKRNTDDRQEFFNSAMIRMLMPVDSHANFVMMNIQHQVPEVIEHFRHHKIMIGRYFPPMDTYIRVSLGNTADMRAFWQAWDLLPWSKKFMHH